MHNFRVFKDKTEIDISIDDPSKNIILIWWKNWHWKSTIIEALNIIFYWATPARLIDSINDEAILNNDSKCSLGIIYEDDSGNEIKIERDWKINWIFNWEREKILPSMIKKDFNAWKNGEKRSISEEKWSEEIEVKIPKWVSEFFFFGWEKVNEKFSWDPKELKTSIEKVIWLDKINTLINDLSRVKWELATSESISDGQIENQQLKIKMVINNIKTKEEQLDEKNKLLTEKRDQRDIKMKREAALSWNNIWKIEDLNEKLTQVEIEKNQLETEIYDYFQNQLSFSLLWPFFKVVDENLQIAKQHREYIWRQGNKTALKEKLIKWLYEPVDIIRWNPWNEKNRSILEDKILSILNEREADEPIFDITETESQRIYNKWHEIDFDWNKVINLINNYEDNESKYISLKNQKDDFYYNNDWQNEKNELQSEIWKLNVEIAKLEAEIEQCQDDLDDLTAQQKDLYNELNRMTRWHAEYKLQTLKIKKIDSYLKTLNDYKEKYRNNKITKLEQNINYMFNLLSSKSKFDWMINWRFENDPVKVDQSLYDCKISINKDTFKVNISYWQSAVRRSWWEETILAISIIWWLSKTSNIDLPIVIDAPVSLLDETHTNNVFRHYFPKAAKQVIILIKDRDMMPWSEWYNSLRDYISKEYTLVFNTDTRDSKVIEWYNF